VRVEKPAELADLMLDGHGPADIAAEINEGVTRTIRLVEPMPVYIHYLTVSIDANDEVHFHPDIYGQDPALIDALGVPGHQSIAATTQARISKACA
jgi:L,D-transpeptidase YcbB